MTATLAVAAPTVRAAGVLPWRVHHGRLQVAVVHRPKYDDWSWPKGKLDDGEPWTAAAVRECLEETGWRVVLGAPLPDASYDIGAGGSTRHKVVRYWAARVVRTQQDLVHEVDDVRWLEPSAAHDLLDYRRDLEQLRAIVSLWDADRLSTWPLAVVRHAASVPRKAWKGDDARRPLTPAGRQRADALVPLLAAYAFTRVVSSPSERCAATVGPYARGARHPLRLKESLSEEGYASHPSRAVHQLERLLERGEPAVVCSHRPVLPQLLEVLATRARDTRVADQLRESAGPGLVKGEALVVHVHGTGPDATAVAVERHGLA